MSKATHQFKCTNCNESEDDGCVIAVTRSPMLRVSMPRYCPYGMTAKWQKVQEPETLEESHVGKA